VSSQQCQSPDQLHKFRFVLPDAVVTLDVLSVKNYTKLPQPKWKIEKKFLQIQQKFLCLFFILSSFKTLTPSGKEVFIELLVRRHFTSNVLQIELPDFALGQQNIYSLLPFTVQKLEQMYVLPKTISIRKL